jgi:hypothetical protein
MKNPKLKLGEENEDQKNLTAWKSYKNLISECRADTGIWNRSDKMHKRFHKIVKKSYSKLLNKCPLHKETQQMHGKSKSGQFDTFITLDLQRDNLQRAMKIKPLTSYFKNMALLNKTSYIRQFYIKKFIILNLCKSIRSPTQFSKISQFQPSSNTQNENSTDFGLRKIIKSYILKDFKKNPLLGNLMAMKKVEKLFGESKFGGLLNASWNSSLPLKKKGSTNNLIVTEEMLSVPKQLTQVCKVERENLRNTPKCFKNAFLDVPLRPTPKRLHQKQASLKTSFQNNVDEICKMNFLFF